MKIKTNYELFQPEYVIREISNIKDGDTITCTIDQGRGIDSRNVTIRFKDIDTWENKKGTGLRRQHKWLRENGYPLIEESDVLARGHEAHTFLCEHIVTGHNGVFVQTELDKYYTDKTGSFGRLLGTIFVVMGANRRYNLNKMMIRYGHATPYGMTR